MSNKNLPNFGDDEETSEFWQQNISTHSIDLRTLIHEIGVLEPLGIRDLSETDFGKLLQAIPIPTLLIDRSATISFANQSWKKITESYRAIVGRPFSSIFAKKSGSRAANSIVEKGFTTRKPLMATAVLEIEQSRIYGRMHVRSLRMGSDMALIVLVEDLTTEKKQLILAQKHKEALLKHREDLEKQVKQRTSALKTMNEKLLASRASFTSIVEKASEGILVADSKNIVQYANPSAASLLGHSKDELIGRHLGLKIFPGQASEIRGKRLNGQPGVLEVRVESTDWNDRPAMLLMLRDITDRKRAEQEMLKTEKLESLELVAGGIAHDFNNLLTGTIANISLAKMHSSRGNAQYEALRNAEKAATGAKNLTQQLLTFTKGGEPLKKPGLISQLLKDCITLALSGSSIRSEVNIPSHLWPAEIDELQMGQVFQNVLINALQAMPNGGTLTINAENFLCCVDVSNPFLKQGKYLKITVRDTGCGISPDNLGKIFDPYFTTKPKGSGIGLATAYSVIKRHGGVIDVNSSTEGGTAFFIFLPACPECEIEAPVSDSGEMPVFGTGKILLMDDDDSIREVAGDLLRLLGYEVELAEDGLRCVEKFKAAIDSGKPFSAVVMDLTVPGGMGGREAMEKLLEVDPTIKAIVSSGYSTDPVMSNFRKYGFSGMVSKPYNAVELSRALRELT